MVNLLSEAHDLYYGFRLLYELSYYTLFRGRNAKYHTEPSPRVIEAHQAYRGGP